MTPPAISCLNTSEARVANLAFTAKESVRIDLAAHFCPPVISNVLVMALGETGEIAFTHGCHPRSGYIVSLDGVVSSRTCTSLPIMPVFTWRESFMKELSERLNDRSA